MNCKIYAGIQDDQYGFWTAPTKNKPSEFVALGKAIIVKKITKNIETNEVRLELAIDYMGNVNTITIDREELSDNRLIQSLNKIGAKAPKAYFDILVASIMRQETDLELDGYKPSLVYSHLGWVLVPVRNEAGIITGNQLHYRANHLLGGCSAKYDGPYSVSRMGTLEKWCDMVKSHIIGHTPLELVLLASLSAVVNGLIGPLTTGENPIFHLCGPSGCGKTTSLYAACSVYGIPYEGEKRHVNKMGEITINRSIYGSWGATENSTTAQCCGNMGAAIIMNELGKFDGKDMSRICYNMSEGTDKTRLDNKMTAYSSESYATTIISSGEVSLLDRCTSKVTGLQVRVLEISDHLTQTAAQSRAIKDISRSNNGWAGPTLAQYILDNGGVDMVLAVFKKYCQSLPEQLPCNATSARFIEKFVALIMTTAELAGNALNLTFDTAGLLQYFIDHEVINGSSRNVTTDSYSVMIEACDTYKTSFYRKGEPDPGIKSFGRITYPNTILPDGRVVIEQYEIRRSFVEATLSKHHFPNPTACYRQWRDMGVLDYEKGKFTRGRKIDPSSEKDENVFVLRVYGKAPALPVPKAKSKLIKRPPSQIKELLDNTEEEDDHD